MNVLITYLRHTYLFGTNIIDFSERVTTKSYFFVILHPETAIEYESSPDYNSDARGVEYIYDIRVVRTPETQ